MLDAEVESTVGELLHLPVINIPDKELEAARWFHCDWLRSFIAGTDHSDHGGLLDLPPAVEVHDICMCHVPLLKYGWPQGLGLVLPVGDAFMSCQHTEACYSTWVSTSGNKMH